jgi:hypothetical protein
MSPCKLFKTIVLLITPNIAPQCSKWVPSPRPIPLDTSSQFVQFAGGWNVDDDTEPGIFFVGFINSIFDIFNNVLGEPTVPLLLLCLMSLMMNSTHCSTSTMQTQFNATIND